MLTDTKVKQAKATGRSYKLADGRGLYLYVSARGAKSWRYDYRLAGRRQTVTLGLYPDVSLRAVREAHIQARARVAQGVNPAAEKQRQKAEARTNAANTFRKFAERWYADKAPHRSESWASVTRAWLDNEILPILGSLPLKQVRPGDVLNVLNRFQERGALVSAEKARGLISNIFQTAIRNMLADFDPAQSLRGAIVTPKVEHHPTLNQQEIPAFLEAVDGYSGEPSTRIAILLLLYTFVRKTELSAARKDELELESAEWRIPATRMKMGEPHIVPLSQQAAKLFKEQMKYTSGSVFVFPHRSDPKRHMGPSRINDALRALGYTGKFTPHGARALASSALNEQGWRPDVIDRQLAHTERNKVRAAYNRAEYLDERSQMMQAWADYLDGLCERMNVVTLRRA